MFEIGDMQVVLPKLETWEKRPLKAVPGEGISASSSFHQDGKVVVAYLTPGTHERLLRDLDEFKLAPSAVEWQQGHQVTRLTLGAASVVRVGVQTGGVSQIQYFFEIAQRSVNDEAALLAIVISLPRERDQGQDYDALFRDMRVRPMRRSSELPFKTETLWEAKQEHS